MTRTAVVCTRVLGVLLLLASAGCTTSASDDGAGPPAAAVGDGGALDTVTDSLVVRELGGVTTTQDAAVGPDGEPVLLFAVDQGAGGPLAVVRPTAGEGWGQVVLQEYDAPVSGSGLDVAPDGTVVVAGYSGETVSVTRIGTDGTVRTVPVAADLDPEVGDVSATALAPDGTRLYLAAHRVGEDAVRLLAVDVATGAVAVERVVPSTGRSWNRLDVLAVDPQARYAYLGGLHQPRGSDDTALTAVDLRTGDVGAPVSLCDGWSVDAVVVPDVAGPATVAVTCDPEVSETTLVTLA